MSDADYAELERLARQATPGPWQQVSVSDNNDRWTVRHPPTGSSLFVGGRVRNEADAAYIAAASPDVVLALLARRAPGDRGIVRYLRAARTRRSLARALGGNPEAGFDAYLSMATAALVKMADEQEAWDRALAADSRPEQPRAECGASADDSDGHHVCRYPRGHRPGDGHGHDYLLDPEHTDRHWCEGVSGHTSVPFGHWFTAPEARSDG